MLPYFRLYTTLFWERDARWREKKPRIGLIFEQVFSNIVGKRNSRRILPVESKRWNPRIKNISNDRFTHALRSFQRFVSKHVALKRYNFLVSITSSLTDVIPIPSLHKWMIRFFLVISTSLPINRYSCGPCSGVNPSSCVPFNGIVVIWKYKILRLFPFRRLPNRCILRQTLPHAFLQPTRFLGYVTISR